jgi:hypothetical protein
VAITSKRGSVTRRTKLQLKFETVMGPNTWQVKTRMPRKCSAPVCFRKKMTAEVESVAALVWNGVTLFSSVWKVKFQFAICASSLEEELKVLFSCCCYSYIHLYVYIKIHENPLFHNWKTETNYTTFFCPYYFVQIMEATEAQTLCKDL